MKVSRILFFVALAVVAVWVFNVVMGEVENPNRPGYHLAWAIVAFVSLLLFIPALIAMGFGY